MSASPPVGPPYLSVGMPAYNEAGQLESTLAEVVPALERLAIPFEIVVVDDGSKDTTPQIADTLAAGDPRIRVVHHPHNMGIGAGIATAIRSARGEFFILIPADIAVELDDLSKYIERAPDADIVAGYNTSRSEYTRYRHAVSWLNRKLLQTLFGIKVHHFNYIHLCRLSIIHQFALEYTGSALLYAEIFVKAKLRGARIVQVQVRNRPRTSGVATGARTSLIVRTGRDMLLLWLRYVTGRLKPGQ